jgi:hypothetical protein
MRDSHSNHEESPIMTRHAAHIASRIVLVLILSGHLVQAQEPAPSAARVAVQTWLALVDSRSYADSWETAASIFKGAITRDKWQAAVQSARGPLGRLKSRTLKNPSAPPVGDSAVFQFEASFEKKSAAVETVTAVKEGDGTWHVAGYIIK